MGGKLNILFLLAAFLLCAAVAIEGRSFKRSLDVGEGRPCEEAIARAYEQWNARQDGVESDQLPLPDCDPETGLFLARQSGGGFYWCVDVNTGENVTPIKGRNSALDNGLGLQCTPDEPTPTKPLCEIEREQALETAEYIVGIDVPKCDPVTNLFEKKQCRYAPEEWGPYSTCWCADPETGKDVEPRSGSNRESGNYVSLEC